MYMTMRRVRCAPGRIGEVLAAGIPLVETINERFGVDFSAAINIGGDPDLIGMSAAFADMEAFQNYRTAAAADDELTQKGAEIAKMLHWTEDRIGRVLRPPGERAEFSGINFARMHLPRVAEAIPFGLEVAEFVEAKNGIKTGFVTSTTGDRSVVAWVARYGSLNEMAEASEALEADPEYLDFFKRSADLYVDGSLEQTIWQRVL